MRTIESLFENYGYLVLLIGLLLEFIALPFPGEVTMSYCGYLVYQGKMDWVLSVIVAAVGSIIGITISYVLGYKLGYPFFYKYGKYIHLKRERLDKNAAWFDKYGRRIIFFAYFFPGIRHITGYFSGITRLSFTRFAANAYLGAFFWTLTFISVGASLGSNWSKLHTSLKNLGVIGGVLLFIVVVGYYIIKYYRKIIFNFFLDVIRKLLKGLHSIGKMRLAITITSFMFLGLSAWMIKIIQDIISHENTKFDEISNNIVMKIYSPFWELPLKVFKAMSLEYGIGFILFLGIMLIIAKSKERFLELRTIVVTTLGGEILIRVLNQAFHKYNPNGIIGGAGTFTYPSPEAMGSIITYGFLMFLVYKYSQKHIPKLLTFIFCLLVIVFSGQAVLYLQLERPSDVLAGYIFGGVWLSLNIIIMEIYRILPTLKSIE